METDTRPQAARQLSDDGIATLAYELKEGGLTVIPTDVDEIDAATRLATVLGMEVVADRYETETVLVAPVLLG